MMLSAISRLLCGIILLTVPTIIYGGYYLLTILSGNDSAGFFAAAIGSGLTKPNRFIGVLYTGALVLVASLLVLGIALIKVG